MIEPGQAAPDFELPDQDAGMTHDDEITSDELDGLLDEAQTLNVARPTGDTKVRLYVAVDPETLHDLEQRAAGEGSDLNAVAADALRAGAHAA